MVLAILRHEGAGSLWQGLRPALAMSLPSTVLYMMAYEELRTRLQRSESSTLATWGPLIAGMTARSFAAAAVAPIELVRTQMQSGLWKDGMGWMGGMHETIRAHGVVGLYRGLAPTLLRDIPFSGLYWMLYERNKARCEAAGASTFVASFAAGASSGMVAACVTTPFDVIKTRMQIAIYSHKPTEASRTPPGPIETLRTLLRVDGPAALASGMGARMTKVAPACAIMISSYELGKSLFTADV